MASVVCPSAFWSAMTSTPALSALVANVWRNLCGLTWNARLGRQALHHRLDGVKISGA